jgi:GAF domain-containing protein
MEQILAISHEFTVTLSLEAILHRIIQVATDLMDCESVGILLWDEQANNLRFVAATLFQDQLLDIPVPIDTSIAGASFASAQPVIVNNVANDLRYYAKVGEAIGLPARSLLAVPLQFRDHKIGVLEAENKRRNKKFDALDVETLTALAVQTTIAIENARLYEQAQQDLTARARAEDALRQQRDQLEAHMAERTRELSALYDVSAIAARAHNLETLFRDALARTMTALECSMGAILLASEKGSAAPSRLQIVARQGLPPDAPMDRALTLATNDLFAMMCAQRQSVLISDLSADPRLPAAMRALSARAVARAIAGRRAGFRHGRSTARCPARIQHRRNHLADDHRRPVGHRLAESAGATDRAASRTDGGTPTPRARFARFSHAVALQCDSLRASHSEFR